MTQTPVIPSEKLFAQVLDPTSRADPYPLYARLRQTPVSLQEDGTYVVSTYREINLLLHDPRISSDERKSAHPARTLDTPGGPNPPAFIFTDPPLHTLLRRQIMQQFTPQRIGGMQEHIEQAVNALLDARKQQHQFDLVQDFAYPLPVTIICRLLGVPTEDEPRFRGWSSALVRTLDPTESLSEAEKQHAVQSHTQLIAYMKQLSETRRAHPQDDLFSALVVGDSPDGRLSEPDLLATMVLLLIAGHETTVNLITNSMLALLRHPEVFERLRRNPDLAIATVEEMLRYDPPVQFRTRTTLADISIAGVSIPKGARVALLLASGSHDPARFVDPDRFWPEREENEHLGFGGSDHYCVGAPLARREGVVAVKALARRLQAPRLVTDPPPYRKNAALRGPEHLQIAFEHLNE
ncbi:cytochrome P450 [Reticulibacter mediterranei]|uniref:Cytochrome P450 n=1 Tax=Reticulibacter mediterranei TaxID=2778369 RepID=A0A8J3NA83_9CHLR|nr:cytochrome P450 [Reticulibacter mediterranei]GHP00113.1 cytochrome P450 [Reticulibacter mediterranei]